jgi:hypothetical protein
MERLHTGTDPFDSRTTCQHRCQADGHLAADPRRGLVHSPSNRFKRSAAANPARVSQIEAGGDHKQRIKRGQTSNLLYTNSIRLHRPIRFTDSVDSWRCYYRWGANMVRAAIQAALSGT